jgi:hypothetical protein
VNIYKYVSAIFACGDSLDLKYNMFSVLAELEGLLWEKIYSKERMNQAAVGLKESETI